MCLTIVINKGESEIETPQEFIDHFGFEPLINDAYKNIDYQACLCQIEVEESLTQHNIPFKYDGCDVYVGMLDNIDL